VQCTTQSSKLPLMQYQGSKSKGDAIFERTCRLCTACVLLSVLRCLLSEPFCTAQPRCSGFETPSLFLESCSPFAFCLSSCYVTVSSFILSPPSWLSCLLVCFLSLKFQMRSAVAIRVRCGVPRAVALRRSLRALSTLQAPAVQSAPTPQAAPFRPQRAPHSALPVELRFPTRPRVESPITW